MSTKACKKWRVLKYLQLYYLYVRCYMSAVQQTNFWFSGSLMWEQEKFTNRTMRSFGKGEMNSTGKLLLSLTPTWLLCGLQCCPSWVLINRGNARYWMLELALALKPTSYDENWKTWCCEAGMCWIPKSFARAIELALKDSQEHLKILKAATQNTARWFSEDCVEIQKLLESQNQPSSQ